MGRVGQTYSLFGRHRDNAVSRPTLPLSELLVKLAPETVPNTGAGARAKFALVAILFCDSFLDFMPFLRLFVYHLLPFLFTMESWAWWVTIFKVSGP